jgi:hypothetical protein
LTDIEKTAKQKIKLAVRNYYRENRQFILLVCVGFIVGLATILGNLYTYDNSLNKAQSNESIVFDNGEPARFNFSLDQPSLAQDTSITVGLEGTNDRYPAEILLNGEKVAETTSSSVFLTPDSNQLSEQNKVVVRPVELSLTRQSVSSYKVTSTTRFRQLVFLLLNLGGLILMTVPVLYVKYSEFQRIQAYEEEFPEFLRDVLEGARAGMSLPQSVRNTSTSTYNEFDEEVDRITAQLDWGIPFDKTMQNMAERSESGLIKRSVDTIIQAYQSGGNIDDVLGSVVDNIKSVQKLKQKRQNQLYGEMITGYVVYFIFIGILVGLTRFLLPTLVQAQSSLGGGGLSTIGVGGFLSGGGSLEQNIQLYKRWFKNLAYIQAVFSGLIIGKLSEGKVRAGLKHVTVLFGVGYVVVTFFI